MTVKSEFWNRPEIETKKFFWDMQTQTHILIGGTTGSGKSNLLEGFIYSLLANDPTETQFILVDPKMTALKKYRRLPHTLKYAIDTPDIAEAIELARDLMYDRYEGLLSDDFATDYEGGDIWLIIDEYAGLQDMLPKRTMQCLNDIACKGRAAKVHIVFCTQRPTREVITGLIKANVTATVGLKTSSERESRNLIGTAECKYITCNKSDPDNARVEAIYNSTNTEGDNVLIEVPYADPDDIKKVIDHWMMQVD